MALFMFTDALIRKVTGGVIIGLDGVTWSATPGYPVDGRRFTVSGNREYGQTDRIVVN
jgi:hypothetical protein